MRRALAYGVRCRASCAVWAILLLMPGGQVGYAQNRFWSPIPVDTDWLNGANWIPEGVPTSEENVKITHNGTYDISLPADQTVRSLTLGAPGGAQTLHVESSTLTLLERSTIQGFGELVLADAAVVGPLEVRQNTSTVRLQGATLSLLLANEGLVEAADSVNTIQAGASSFNSPLGTVRVLAASQPTSLTFQDGSFPRLLLNQGRIEVLSEGSAPATLNLAGGFVQNLGTGVLHLSGDPGAAVLNLAHVENHGLIEGQGRLGGNLVNHSRVIVGASAGTLQIDGRYAQASDASSIEFEIGGSTPETQHVLDVTGPADLAGRLVVDFRDGFQPAEGEEFRLIRRDGGEGQFDAIQVSGIPGYTFSADYTPDDVTLEFRQEDVLRGDFNNNGRVEQADLDLVLLNWGERGRTPIGWTNDLPDDFIDQAELDRVLLGWNNRASNSNSTSNSTAALGAGGVPEPATWALLLGGLAALLGTRVVRVRPLR